MTSVFFTPGFAVVIALRPSGIVTVMCERSPTSSMTMEHPPAVRACRAGGVSVTLRVPSGDDNDIRGDVLPLDDRAIDFLGAREGIEPPFSPCFFIAVTRSLRYRWLGNTLTTVSDSNANDKVA